MSNPFCFCEGNIIREINPIRDPNEINLFVSVDGTEKAHKDFKVKCSPTLLKSRGFFSIAYGPDGCGKSSLIYRNAFSIVQKISKPDNSKIVDLSSFRLLDVPSAEKSQRVYHWTVDDLSEASFIPASLTEKLERFDDPQRGMAKLSRELTKSEKTLIIILPQIDLLDDLSTLLILMYPNILLLGETTLMDVHNYCNKSHPENKSNYIHSVELSKLRVEDGMKFITSRLEGKKQGPSIDGKALTKVMIDRVGSNSGMNIRELHKLCANVYDIALKNNLENIDFDLFAKHYFQNASM